jgi:hypothetical protein
MAGHATTAIGPSSSTIALATKPNDQKSVPDALNQ